MNQNMAPKQSSLPCFEAWLGHISSRFLFIALPCMWGAGVTRAFLSNVGVQKPQEKLILINNTRGAETPPAVETPTPTNKAKIYKLKYCPPNCRIFHCFEAFGSHFVQTFVHFHSYIYIYIYMAETPFSAPILSKKMAGTAGRMFFWPKIVG